MIILYILGCLVALVVVIIMGLMFFDLSGKALARAYEWFLRRF